jgi:hypothetical protein
MPQLRRIDVIVALVTDTVTGMVTLNFPPSEIRILAVPLMFVPIPIEVAVKIADEPEVDDPGVTVTIVVSLLVAVKVPANPVSLTLMRAV